MDIAPLHAPWPPARTATRYLILLAVVTAPATGLQPSLPWYGLTGLDFACTGCSKCCKIQGTVTATEAEVKGMARELKMPFEQFKRVHVDSDDGKWFYLKSRRGLLDGSEACTLLGEDGRCTAYAEPARTSVSGR